jgi:hypothetical protein
MAGTMAAPPTFFNFEKFAWSKKLLLFTIIAFALSNMV